MKMEEDDIENVCMIDAGVTSMMQVAVSRNLTSLNLHANNISHIRNLDAAFKLQYLDLSSNVISCIEGLDQLTCLHTLNLSCNTIRTVTGLQCLYSLVRCDLSYNIIENLEGFLDMSGSRYQLKHLDVHSNLIGSVKMVTQCLIGCRNLKSLVLEQTGDSSVNKLCSHAGYQQEIFKALPWLTSVNYCNLAGELLLSDEDAFEIFPGFKDFAKYLRSSNSSLSPSKIIAKATPRIDAALDAFKRQPDRIENSSAALNGESNKAETQASRKAVNSHCESSAIDRRLGALEHQISSLLGCHEQETQNSKKHAEQTTSSGKVAKSNAKTSNVLDDKSYLSSGSSTEDVWDATENQLGKVHRVSGSRLPSRIQRKNAPVMQSRTGFRQKPSGEQSLIGVRKNYRMSKDGVTGTTYSELLKKCEAERERRWKAEMAVQKLTDRITNDEKKLSECEALRQTNAETVRHLKDLLGNARKAYLRLKEEKENAVANVRNAEEKLAIELQSEKDLQGLLRSKEELSVKVEQEYMKQQSLLSKRAHESQLRASALARELDLVKSQTASTTSKIQQLQELLASREQEHKKELEGRLMLGSGELEEYVERELRRQREGQEREVVRWMEDCSVWERKYDELEDEFRYALHTESERYECVRRSYEQLQTQHKQKVKLLESAEKKLEACADRVTQLTAVVTEQKGRLAELLDGRQQQQAAHRDRVAQLEQQLEDSRRAAVQTQLLKQEKVKLSAQLLAHESLIEGLRAEKRLWGDELARQSAALAQDRGRMELKIDTLQNEVATLKRHLEREVDSVRIKSKVIEDQNETVGKLKSSLQEMTAQLQQLQEEAVVNQRVADEQLNSELQQSRQLAEQLAREQTRKQELKSDVAKLREQLGDAETRNKQLAERLDEFAVLETQVAQMKEGWEVRERQLVAERDAAVKTAGAAASRVRTADDKLQMALRVRDREHERRMAETVTGMQADVDAAHTRAAQVEDEMRMLLKEVETSKRLTEAKIKRLTMAFTDLQEDVST